LAGGVAHDFNNILQGMNLNLEFALQSLPADSPQRDALESALKFGRRGKKLVEQILTFSRVDDHSKKSFGVVEVAREVVRMMRSMLPASITLVEHFRHPDLRVLGNPTQVHQVMVNLCSN